MLKNDTTPEKKRIKTSPFASTAKDIRNTQKYNYKTLSNA
jgi:hypothetical protein